MNKEVFSGRPYPWLLKHFKSFGKKLGILSTEGEVWTSQRKFTLKTLKDFGFGRKGSENIIQEEAIAAVEHLKQFQGQDFFLSVFFNVPIVNVLWKMVASKRFEMDDPAVEDLMQKMNKMFTTNSIALYLFPFLRHIAPNLTTYTYQKELFESIHADFRKCVQEHKATRDPNEPRDFIDVFLNEIDKGTEHFNEEQLLVDILDLFLAGAETTSTTLKWAVIFLARHPAVQRKCHEEVLSVVGPSRQPSLSDLERLPFCEATILEVQRMGAIAPASLIHTTRAAANIGEYQVPKGTRVLVNIQHMMFSPKYFHDPYEFRPDRFLEGGQVRRDLDHFMPFGVGRRVCLGEALAKNELAIFFTTLIQNLRFEMPEDSGSIPPDENKFDTGVTRVPHSYHVKICSA